MRNHRDDMLALVDQLRAHGVSPYVSAPPLWRLAWRLGWRWPTPLAMPFWELAFVQGTGFAVLWGAVMWITLWRLGDYSVERSFATAIIAGVLFGVSMASYYRSQRWRLDHTTFAADR